MKTTTEIIMLNKNQTKAVSDTAYPSYLQAGAGSGKTRVLVEKIIHIIKIEPAISLENFAVITFTNKATDELAHRLQTALYRAWIDQTDSELANKLRAQIPICNMVDISTIHGFCEKLLRRHGVSCGIPNTFAIKSFRQETREVVTKHVNRFSNNSAFGGIAQYKIVDLILELLRDNGNKGMTITEQHLEGFTFNTPDNSFFNIFKSALIGIYSKAETEIEEIKAKENIVAANDLITLATTVLNVPKVSKRVSEKYKYLFVDEFQDTNYQQFIFIEKMINLGVKVFVIGDKKQSIYAFRGADVENTDRIDNLLKSTKRKNLNVNYRTDPQLLSYINTIFSSEFTFEDMVIEFPHQELQSGVEIDSCEEPFRFEYKKSVETIVLETVERVKIGAKNAAFEDIAILCRRNADVDFIGRKLKAKGIPVEIIGGKGFYANTEIIDTYKLFNTVIYKSNETLLEGKNTFYHRALQNVSDICFEDFMEQLDAAFKTLTVENILSFIFTKSRTMEYLRNLKQYQAVANLLKLKDKARELTRGEAIKPLQFLEYLDIMITSGKDEDEAEVSEEDRRNGVVSLYSIHKAKGLEFPIVIVPNCDMPIYRKTILPQIIYDPEHMKLAIHHSFMGKDSEVFDKDYDSLLHGKLKLNFEEELRILYVACTRAKNMLVLACKGDSEQARLEASWAKWILDSKIGEYNQSP